MLSKEKKRKVMIFAAFGAISGAALFAVLYLLMGYHNLIYTIFIPAAAAMAAGQAYLAEE